MMKEFITAWQFLTRIKISKNTQLSSESLAGTFVYFPLVGLIIGAMLMLLGYGALIIFKPLLVVILIVIGEILITGGLHLDGFMDSCDGLFSGRDRARVLEIMKDSRVGAMGVTGVLILFGLKIGLLYELVDSPIILPVIVVIPIISRWIMVFVMARFPSARAQGLGELFRSGISNRQVWWVSIYSVALILLILPWYLSVALILTLPIIIMIAGTINRVLGGHTGDTYGFMNEISGVIFLLGVTLMERISSIIF